MARFETSAAPAEAPRLTELERLKRRCQRQAMEILALRDVVAGLSSGARALKAENAELRAQAARSRPRHAGGHNRVEGAELAEVSIPIGVRAPAMARGVVGRCLSGVVAQRVLENAQLLVSELVTNSVRHSGAGKDDDVVVRVHLWRDTCRLEVEDPGAGGRIEPRQARPGDSSGMGLNLVEMLGDRWGVVRAADGPTRVWVQLTCGTAAA